MEALSGILLAAHANSATAARDGCATVCVPPALGKERRPIPTINKLFFPEEPTIGRMDSSHNVVSLRTARNEIKGAPTVINETVQFN